MGAEQSALLACSQTGIPEIPLSLPNSELFFRLYFDKMPKPKTGPVTEALLHLVQHTDFRGPAVDAPDSATDIDSGFENDESEILPGESLINNDRLVLNEEWEIDSDISIGSAPTNLNSYDGDDDLEPLVWNPLEPMETFETDDDFESEMDESFYEQLPYFDHFVEEEE